MNLKIENVLKVTQFGFGIGSKPVSMYVTSLPARELLKRTIIFKRTPSRRNGYQREIPDVRLGKGKTGIPGYLLKQMGIFPTSILVNIRKGSKIKFTSALEIAEKIQLGILTVSDDAKWYVIDGQHRIEGLKKAIREEKELREFPLIITFTNEDLFFEMLIFYIVNNRIKSVPTDLAYRILQTMYYDVKAPKWIEKEILTGADRRKAKAAEIVDFLNLDIENPFKGRVQEVGETKKKIHLTTDGTLARYVAEVFRERTFLGMNERNVADLLAMYWIALKQLYPLCFDKHDDYLLLSTLGLSSLMRLFPVIYGYISQDNDVSTKNMHRYLMYLLEQTPKHPDYDFQRPINEQWWNREEGPPGIIKGTGEGHYRYVSDSFAKKISLEVDKTR